MIFSTAFSRIQTERGSKMSLHGWSLQCKESRKLSTNALHVAANTQGKRKGAFSHRFYLLGTEAPGQTPTPVARGACLASLQQSEEIVKVTLHPSNSS